MIGIDIRIYGWMMQMQNSRAMWSEKQIEADEDHYMESIEYHYNGINRYL